MARRLEKKPEMFEHLPPSCPVACRRVSPGPRYLECLVDDKVNFIPSGVKEISESDIIDDLRTLREVNSIICATGFDTSLRLDDSPIYGANCVSLDDLWKGEPGAYMSICPPQMPNLFLFVGPNGAPGVGSTIHMSECACEYMILASAVHQRATLENPRFEDFDYSSFDDGDPQDMLAWMGNGMIEAQE